MIGSYTTKELFNAKIRGEPLDFLRKNFGKDMRWCLEHDIFSVAPGDHYQSYRYTCLYPVRVWHTNGKGAHKTTTVDHLQPGEVWIF